MLVYNIVSLRKKKKKKNSNLILALVSVQNGHENWNKSIEIGRGVLPVS